MNGTDIQGFDIQSALEVAKQLRNFQQWATHFGHDRERILEEIGLMADGYVQLAEDIDELMSAFREQEAA